MKTSLHILIQQQGGREEGRGAFEAASGQDSEKVLEGEADSGKGVGDIRLSPKEKRVLVEKGATSWSGKVKKALQRARKGVKEDLKSKKEDLVGK